MGACCDHECALDALQRRQRQTLKITLAINALMFGVILGAALFSRSTALLAESLDNLGDALTYGLSLYAVSRDRAAKARVALFKSSLIFIGAAVVAGQIVYRLLSPRVPAFEIMGGFTLLGLAANGVCLWLLWRHRQEDVNMSSVWECSRNDVAANVSVLLAAGLVWLFGSAWPDLVVAAGLAWLLLRSSRRVFGSALSELRAATG